MKRDPCYIVQHGNSHCCARMRHALKLTHSLESVRDRAMRRVQLATALKGNTELRDQLAGDEQTVVPAAILKDLA